MLYVEIWRAGDRGAAVCNTIAWDGRTFRVDPPAAAPEWLRPVATPSGLVGPETPVEFLNALRAQYRGTYLWAVGPKEGAPPPVTSAVA